jgi:hypothetical protein
MSPTCSWYTKLLQRTAHKGTRREVEQQKEHKSHPLSPRYNVNVFILLLIELQLSHPSLHLVVNYCPPTCHFLDFTISESLTSNPHEHDA